MLLSICVVACTKDLSTAEKDENAPQLVVVVENIEDSATVRSDLPDEGNGDGTGEGQGNSNGGGSEGPQQEDGIQEIATEKNEHAVYSFLGVSGLYFGCSSSFRSDNEILEFIIGTNKTHNLKFTREEFEELIQAGERQFGSLGAFNTFPERFSNKVEIAFTDKRGKMWCTTHITEKKTTHGLETSIKIDQQKSEFYIDDVHKFEIAAEKEGYRLKGRFECTLYEVNGNAKKKIKGDFTGIVAPE